MTLILKALRKSINLIRPKTNNLSIDFESQEASDTIKNAIESGKPLMVARFGAVELSCMVAVTNSDDGFIKYIKYIKGDISNYTISDNVIAISNINAGIFPAKKNTLINFSELMLKDAQDLDILGSWLKEEKTYTENLKNLIKIPLKDIEPYYHKSPWSKALENKTVLVIHPFTETIEKQYKKRELLFENKDVLPKFELKTIKAVQSIAGQQKLPYKDWFEALESMKEKIDRTEFDIAILGCGAYGFPLAAHIKRLGKQAIHMGGATQILFGIKGKRWMNHKTISNLFNENWVRPSEEETPKNKDKVEDGCYW